jgi:hypothetical protein
MTEPNDPNAVELLDHLAANFRKWLEDGPNAQPRYPNGIRPWSTGDLRALIEALDAGTAALRAPVAGKARATLEAPGLVGELERLIEARKEPAALFKADHPRAFEVAMAASARVDRKLAEFVEVHREAILAALRPNESPARDEVLEEAARVAEISELPPDFIWSESNQRKFKFGAETAAARIRALKSTPPASVAGDGGEEG